MEREIHIDPDCHSTRWFAFFDLLGTRGLIEASHWQNVFDVYARSLEKFQSDLSYEPNGLRKICFSDSFIVYSAGSANNDYANLDQFSRIFFSSMVSAQIPLRGAMSFGEFYSDEARSVFFGRALNEAYGYGEMQNWIGFILCPSAVAKIEEYGLSNSLALNYETTLIPEKDKSPCEPLSLPAYVIGGRSNGSLKRQVLGALSSMAQRAESESEKYKNTISFVQGNTNRN